MNRIFKSISVILIAINYCFAVVISNRADFYQNSTFSKIPSSNSYFLSDGMHNLLSYCNEKTDIFIKNFNKLPNFTGKIYNSLKEEQIKEFLFKKICTDRLLILVPSIKYLKIEQIIYPFHYFW